MKERSIKPVVCVLPIFESWLIFEHLHTIILLCSQRKVHNSHKQLLAHPQIHIPLQSYFGWYTHKVIYWYWDGSLPCMTSLHLHFEAKRVSMKQNEKVMKRSKAKKMAFLLFVFSSTILVFTLFSIFLRRAIPLFQVWQLFVELNCVLFTWITQCRKMRGRRATPANAPSKKNCGS
jgi:hypothetical protein